MSNYTKATNFASKDSLLTGNPLKIVKGTEIDNEFNAISTAISTKFDTASLAAPGPIGATTPAAISGTTISGTTGTFSGDVQMASINGGQLAGLRNRIINGDMRVNQRNATVSTDGTYGVDRWLAFRQAGSFSSSQSTDVPANSGFVYSNLWSSGSTTSTGYSGLSQRIEGANIADLAWGTSAAKTVTLSFWVKAGLIGQYSVTLRNGTQTRAYSATYTVNVVDTWEYKTVVIPGDTTGTWATGVGWGVEFWFSCGGTVTQTGNAWAAGNFQAATGNVALYALASGGNFRITGVQVEVGPVASIFEQIPYGLSLALCQRYYSFFPYIIINVPGSDTQATFPVTMRANPNLAGGGAGFTVSGANNTTFTASQTTRVAQTITATSEL